MGTDRSAAMAADGSRDYSGLTHEQVVHELGVVDQYARPKDTANLVRRYRELVDAEPPENAYGLNHAAASPKQLAEELRSVGGRSVAAPTLVIINCAVLVAVAAMGGGFWHADDEVLRHWGANFGPYTLDGEWWRVLTAIFLHFGLWQLATNMAALWYFGRLTERLYGTMSFLIVYLFAGLCGNVASLLLHPRVDGAGASGAIFGIIGAVLAFIAHPRTPMPARMAVARGRVILAFVAYTIINAFTARGIDTAAHLAGLLGGLLMGWILVRPLDAAARRHSWRRVAAGVLTGVVLLAAASWPLRHPDPVDIVEREFQHHVQQFLAEEQRVLKDEAALTELVAGKRISSGEQSERWSQIAPAWQATRDVIRVPELPEDSRLRDLQFALIRYIAGCAELARLRSEAAIADDPVKARRLKEVAAFHAAQNERVRTLLRDLY